MNPPIPTASQVRTAPARGLDIKKARNWRLSAIALAGLSIYLVATQRLMGLRLEHYVLATVYLALVVAGGRAFRFLGLFLPCVLTGVSYDYFRLVQGLRGEVHVADLYHAELALFGIGSGDSRILLTDFFVQHNHPIFDLAGGIAYIIYLYVPMACAIALFFVDEERMFTVGVVFLATNLLGLMVYLLYPAAPPWYVAQHGLGPVQLDTLPNAAGTVRFDHLLGVDYFTSFYKRSANVFGAMPSLHVAFPAGTMLSLLPLGKRWWVPCLAITLLVAFAAVYFQHHYVLDVLAGFACAVLAWLGATAALKRWGGVLFAPASGGT
ncbi:MAG TPA: phosphatase PAP2 family protein [Polyangiaceae bacterium]|jgi:inositol phosphorylceramide synthase catalytic subunit|nr:phosphatase PAP2 family protein [Polyangiaceae bacterium]